MHNQLPDLAESQTPLKLHPIDQHVLEQIGDLPGLPLLVNPAVLERLRRPPPSVHTIETSFRNVTDAVDRLDAGSLDSDRGENFDRPDYTYRGYLLRPRVEAYVRACEIYGYVDGSYEGKFSSRLHECRKFAWFVQNKHTHKLRVSSSRCKLRWCPICRDVSRMIVTSAVEEWLKIQKYPKMITFTLEHNDDPLQLQVKKIYDCFRKLRTRAFIRRNITGGVWFFQLKWSTRSQQWHPHIHALVAGNYLPHSKLKSLWHKITVDSFVVDVRPVKDLESAATEVARYATSPADLTAMSLDNAIDVYYSTKSKRICGSWGSAKGMVLKPQPPDDDDCWEKVADFFFINVQKEYDPKAKHFWKCFKKGEAYEGPQLQRMADVYKEEIDICLQSEQDNMTYHQFTRKMMQNRAGPWRNFFANIDEPKDD